MTATTTSEALLSLHGVSKRFENQVVALSDISLNVQAGEFVSLLGPSGCGKSTLLGLIGGPLICITGIAVVLGWIEAGGAVQGIATIPEFLWELSLGIYLTVKGFKPSPVFA